ncbi:MAG: hypothetical protein HY854_24555 [Burkholderiales bacterium]|nr:hypothetical protein [Burkholderiales bacterium]
MGKAAALLAAATLVLLARELGLGLETTDEAYYLLHALHPESIRLFFTPFHWVTGPMWEATGSLVAFRALGLALCVASAMLLAEGVRQVAPRAGWPVPGRIAVMAGSVSGALVYGSLLPFTPSYNLLGSVFGCMAMGLGLLAMAATQRAGWSWALAAGVALALATIVKFPAGMGTAGLLALLWLVLAKREEALRLAALLAGAVVTVALLAAPDAVAQFRAGVEVLWAAQGDHSTAGRLLRSAQDIAQMLGAAGIAFGAPLACVAAGVWLQRTWLALAGMAWLAFAIVADGHLAGGYDRFPLQAQPLAALLLAAFIAKARDLSFTVRSALLVASLVALPFAIALGTSNPLHVQLLGALAPWGVLLALAGFAAPRSWPAALAAVMFGITVFAQASGHAGQPYRTRPMAEQREHVTLPQLGQLKVDRPTAAMVQALLAAATRCSIRPGTPFIDLYNLPAAGLVLQAPPLVSPWMLDASHAARVLQHADPAALRGATLVVKSNHAALPPQLAGFPAGWRLCGAGTAPLDGVPFEVWAAAG